MVEGTSWSAKGKDRERIELAVERRDICWDDSAAERLWREVDRTEFTMRIVNDLIATHITGGGDVRGQRNVPGEDYLVWFSIEQRIGDEMKFIKFAIDPEEDDNPGLVIISAPRALK